MHLWMQPPPHTVDTGDNQSLGESGSSQFLPVFLLSTYSLQELEAALTSGAEPIHLPGPSPELIQGEGPHGALKQGAHLQDLLPDVELM